MRRHSYRRQRTLARPAEVEGVGFLTGARVRLRFVPAPPDAGVAFVRTDLRPPPLIPARLDQVTGTQRRTTLGQPPAQVGLVEHVLAALAGLRIDNCFVELNAPEPPGLDGSACGFVEALRRAGTVVQPARRVAWTVEKSVVVAHGGATLAIHPAEGDDLRISYLLDYGPRSPIGRQMHTQLVTPGRFAREVAPCRTFLLEEEATELRRQGLGARTTAADLLVFGPRGPIDNRLRHANEPARHKVLDIVGDLALFGHDLRGHVVAYRSGHPLNVALVRELTQGLTRACRPPLLAKPWRRTMSRLRLAVIGVGHLGKEHARILAAMPDVELVGVADVNAVQAEAVARRCGTRAFADYRALLPHADAAVVVVPTVYHHAVAAEFLRRGIPVLVEKPLAADLAEANELVELARRQRVVLQVGHIERFNPAFEELRRRPLRPLFVSCERLGSFTGRSTDIGAVLDLMIHDLDLLLALAPGPARRVEALGLSVLGGHEDVAHARIVFEGGCVASLSASRVSPAPLRRMQVWSADGFACVDFAKKHLTLMQPSEELRGRRLDPRRLDAAGLARLRAELHERHLRPLEVDCQGGDQLTAELQDFLHCVRTGDRPRASGEDGRDALALAARVLDGLRGHAREGQAA